MSGGGEAVIPLGLETLWTLGHKVIEDLLYHRDVGPLRHENIVTSGHMVVRGWGGVRPLGLYTLWTLGHKVIGEPLNHRDIGPYIVVGL